MKMKIAAGLISTLHTLPMSEVARAGFCGSSGQRSCPDSMPTGLQRLRRVDQTGNREDRRMTRSLWTFDHCRFTSSVPRPGPDPGGPHHASIRTPEAARNRLAKPPRSLSGPAISASHRPIDLTRAQTYPRFTVSITHTV
jgi:hypothetical protein